MATATVDGHLASGLRLQIPAWGVWWCDVSLLDAVELSGAVSVSVAGAEFSGAVVSGGASDGRAAYRIVGGAGGWGAEVAAKSYQSDAGVLVANILSDAAREAGEAIEPPPFSQRVGPHFARRAGLASDVLLQLTPRAWYVGADGVTRFGERAAVEYTSAATRVRRDPANRVVELAPDSAVGLVPGVSVDGSPPAGDVELEVTEEGFAARLFYADAVRPRRLRAWGLLFDALDPNRRYRALHEYRVVGQSGDRLNLQPARASSGMPSLTRVPYRPGIPGWRVTWKPGSLTLVAFADGDPSRPNVLCGDAPDAPGWSPLDVEFGVGGALVARLGDAVQAGPWSGVISAVGQTRCKIGV